MKIAIVENEKSQIEITEGMLKKYFEENKIGYEIEAFENGFDFLEGDISAIDIIFMDIDMPGINGMETAEKIREKNIQVPLIFVTNLPQYAISGYKVNALDFILKPMTYADFSMAMKKAIAMISKENIGDFVLNIHGAVTKFKADDVLYIDMIKHDVNIHMTDGQNIVFRYSLSKIEPLLDSRIYFKCNSGCIVNLRKVTYLKGDILIMENKDYITISRSKKKEAVSRLNDLYSNLLGKVKNNE